MHRRIDVATRNFVERLVELSRVGEISNEANTCTMNQTKVYRTWPYRAANFTFVVKINKRYLKQVKFPICNQK